jgi:type VI secretion system protein ImpE
MRAKQLLDEAKLGEAIAAVTEDLKSQPADLVRRRFLLELLCYAGDLERAERQIQAIGRFASDPAAAVGAQLMRNLFAAEADRRACFERGQHPRFILAPPPDVELRLQAVPLAAAGRYAEAAALVERAEAQRPACAGRRNGNPFDDLRDGDDLLAPVLEVFTPAGYFWVPWEHVQYLEIPPPQRLLDLLWTPAKIASFDGQLGEVHLPCLYHGTAASDDDTLRLGRGTGWTEQAPGLVRGVGRKDFLVGDEAFSLLELGQLEREGPATEAQ